MDKWLERRKEGEWKGEWKEEVRKGRMGRFGCFILLFYLLLLNIVVVGKYNINDNNGIIENFVNLI